MDEEGLKKMKVSELKELLQAKGLPVAGKKEELIHRLLSTDAPEDQQKSPKPQPALQKQPTATLAQQNVVEGESNADVVTIKSSKSRNAMEMTLPVDEIERIKARQARFGTTAPILQELEEARKLEERRQRFTAGI